MSLFLDEKTKEEKFLKAREDREKGLSESLIELDRKGEWLHKLWFNYGWNECEKHVRESASVGFSEWAEETMPFSNGDEDDYLLSQDAWQACSIFKDKEIQYLESQLKERDEALLEIYGQPPMHGTGYDHCVNLQRLKNKHQSLINQIKESRK